MKKLLIILFIPFLAAAVHYIYNTIETDTLTMGHIGNETLSFVVEGEEYTYLTEAQIVDMYNSQWNGHDFEDITFHYIEGSVLHSGEWEWFLDLQLSLYAEHDGEVVIEYDVPSDMTVQIDHEPIASGGTFEVERRDNDFVLVFFFEGEHGEFRDGQFDIEFSFTIKE